MNSSCLPVRHVLCLAAAILAAPICAEAQPPTAALNVTTYKYDNFNSGLNMKETALTPTNVPLAPFGQLFTDPIDGQVYAQPLYLSNVAIPGKGTHNVVYVATCEDTLYAF